MTQGRKNKTDFARIHSEAMDLAELAFDFARIGKYDEAKIVFEKAMKLESQAANALINKLDSEPKRSVLFRSAASLALNCGQTREAERLVSAALAGYPPAEIAEELRDLQETINFERHLEVRGIKLEPTEVQISIAGRDVGFGMAPADEIMRRVSDFERMVHRTIERRQKRPYRERGEVDRNYTGNFSVFMSVPRGGSFSVTLRVGKQNALFDSVEEIINDITDNLTLFNKGEYDKIKEVIVEDAYYANFIGLAKRISPDGEKVSSVSITSIKNDEKKYTQLRSNNLSPVPKENRDSWKNDDELKYSYTGYLKFADSVKIVKKVKLIMENNKAITIIVPPGMMEDIVKPYWDTKVFVTTIKIKGKDVLSDIRPAYQS
jgi:tetratricopeptide (TPR) repeat protein